MGQTVVFTVSLDNDEVAIERTESRPPPRHPYRDAARSLVRDRRWRLAALAVLVAPLLAAGLTAAITGGAWATTALLIVAVIATMASGAFAAGPAPAGTFDERLAHLVVTGLAGAGLAIAALPGVLWAARREGWGDAGIGPTLAVLALGGAAGAWLGMGIASRRPGSRGVLAVAVVAALTLAPIGAYAALLPTTVVTDTVTAHTFTTTYSGARPAYVCGNVEVQATRPHTEMIAWIAFASPAAWIVDAPEFSPSQLVAAPAGSLANAQAWTRSTRVGPDSFEGHCYQSTSLGVPIAVREGRYNQVGPLGAQVAIVAAMAALAFAAATGLRSPSRSASR